MLAGHVDDAGRRALLDAASVLAYPSIYEGFGFPLLEAMSAGVPVVAARAGSIPEVAGDAALLVEPTDDDGARRRDRPGASTTSRPRADLVARGRDRLGDVLVGRHRPGAGGVLPTARGRGREHGAGSPLKVALHSGQLLQPVPGGIGRYTHSLLRVLPTVGVDVDRVRGRGASDRRSAPRRRGSISARRTAACATSAGTGSAVPWFASTPTSCTRRASRSRPCATRRSS